jgi:hypothetical protein
MAAVFYSFFFPFFTSGVFAFLGSSKERVLFKGVAAEHTWAKNAQRRVPSGLY